MYLNSQSLIPAPETTATPQQSDDVLQVLLNAADILIQEGQIIDDKEKFINRFTQNVHVAQYNTLQPVMKRILSISYDNNKRNLSKSEISLLISKEQLDTFEKQTAFTHKFSETFLRYFKQEEDNKYYRYRRDENNETVFALTDEEFVKLKGGAALDFN